MEQSNGKSELSQASVQVNRSEKTVDRERGQCYRTEFLGQELSSRKRDDLCVLEIGRGKSLELGSSKSRVEYQSTGLGTGKLVRDTQKRYKRRVRSFKKSSKIHLIELEQG